MYLKINTGTVDKLQVLTFGCHINSVDPRTRFLRDHALIRQQMGIFVSSAAKKYTRTHGL